MTIPGLGGQVPPRPDQQYQGGQGGVIGPGSPNVVRARLVIVSGAGGSVTGLYVYNGTPAAGNLPVFLAVAPGTTTDPFGNAISAIVEIGQQSGGHWHWDASGNLDVNNTSSALIARWRPTDQALLFYTPGGGLGNLLLALAAAAGTDQDGNPFIKGLQIGAATDTAQIQLIPGSGGAAQVKFPIPPLSLSNVPNFAAGIVSSVYASLVTSGPALTTVGQRDWVQMIMYSNDTIGDQARLELRYVNDAQVPSVMMAMNGNTGVTFHSSVSIDAGNGPFTTGESFHTITNGTNFTGTMRVKKLPWNAIWLDAQLTYNSTAAATTNFGSLPDATYYPTGARQFDLSTTGTPGTGVFPRVFVPASGALQVVTPSYSATGSQLSCSVYYPTN